MKQILLVEDSPTDAELLQSALKAVGATNPVHWISDGNQALKHLEQAEVTAPIAAVIPSVLFLDLRLPGVSGFEILEYLQSCRRLLTCSVLRSASLPMWKVSKTLTVTAHTRFCPNRFNRSICGN
jgi:CheY-like chemotaxis protein